MTKTYNLPSGSKLFIRIVGIIALPILGIGLLMFWLAAKAEVKITDEAFEYWWLAQYRVPWEGATVARVRPKSNAVYKLTSAAGKEILFKPGIFENSDEIRGILEARIAAQADVSPA